MVRNTMASAVLERQKGVAGDLVGGGFVRKAAQKQAADNVCASRDGAGLALLGGVLKQLQSKLIRARMVISQ